jgi:hypothetical protein
MRRSFLPFVTFVCGVVWVSALATGTKAQSTAAPGVARQADAIVANYRKIIVLMDGASALDPGVRDMASTAGKILFQANQELLSKFEEQLDAAVSNGNTAPAGQFLDRLESDSEYRDADKLAFSDALDDLAAAVGSGNEQLATRIREDQNALAQIRRSISGRSGKYWAVFRRAEWWCIARRGSTMSVC